LNHLGLRRNFDPGYQPQRRTQAADPDPTPSMAVPVQAPRRRRASPAGRSPHPDVRRTIGRREGVNPYAPAMARTGTPTAIAASAGHGVTTTQSAPLPPAVLAVAIGVPAPVGHAGEVLRGNVALPAIESVGFVGSFGGAHGWDVLVENDGNLGILGERWRGVAQASDHAVMLLAGERLGAGIVENGRLARGYDGSAGEMDFLDLVDGVGDTRGVGNIARELGDLAVAKVRENPTTSEEGPGVLLAREAGDAEHVTSQHVLRAAVASDPAATEIVDVIAERMAARSR